MADDDYDMDGGLVPVSSFYFTQHILCLFGLLCVIQFYRFFFTISVMSVERFFLFGIFD